MFKTTSTILSLVARFAACGRKHLILVFPPQAPGSLRTGVGSIAVEPPRLSERLE